jgi:hypothetical protein
MDFSEFLTKKSTKDEALDLLGEFLDPTVTGLFGDRPIKIAKPRPKWHVDGFYVIKRRVTCLTCGGVHLEANPRILLSESLIDHEGNVLKSVKSSNPESLRHSDVDYSQLRFFEELVDAEPVCFCNHCFTRRDASPETVELAFRNQLTLDRARKEAEALPATGARDLMKAEQAEKELFDLIAKFEGEN